MLQVSFCVPEETVGFKLAIKCMRTYLSHSLLGQGDVSTAFDATIELYPQVGG